MKNKFKKTAFTIVEAVVCFTVMGLIFIAVMTNINISDNYYNLYYRAFDTLLQAAGNANAQWSPECTCSDDGTVSSASVCWSKTCWEKTQTINGTLYSIEKTHLGGTSHGREYPGYLFGDATTGDWDGSGTDEAFCKLLTSQINTLLPVSECTSFITKARVNTVNTKGTKFFEAFCYSSDDDNSKCSTDSIEPSFVAANGQRFYISSVTTANAINNLSLTNSTIRRFYRFVVVDLNGTSGPNTQFKSIIKYPDLVLFALSSDGNVIPLGLPEFSTNYINARVYYPEYLNELDTSTGNYKKNTLSVSDPTTLWYAKMLAWGMNGWNDTQLYKQKASWSEPLSQSVIFYNNANECANGCTTDDSTKKYVDELYVGLVTQFLFKEASSSDLYEELSTATNTLVQSEYGCTSGDSLCKIDFVHDD